ncbi:MAG: HAD family hydrolase, partial [Candidatus Woesearchaeota archaeon]
ERAFNEKLKQYHKKISFKEGKFGGVPTEQILEDIFEQQVPKDLSNDIKNNTKEIFAKKTPQLLPGVKEFLEMHKNNYTYAICSGSPKETIIHFLQELHIDSYFSVILSGDEVAHPKPAPDIWLTAANMLNVEPKNCIVFEDALSGMLGGKKAGMKVIAINTQKTNYPADIYVPSFEHIQPKDLEKLFIA